MSEPRTALSVGFLVCLLQMSVAGAQTPVEATPAQSLTPRCGTVMLLPLAQARASFSRPALQGLRPPLTRPTQPGEGTITGGLGHSYAERTSTPPTSYVSPGGHFKVWYVASGPDRPGAGRSDHADANGNGIPDWVEQCADIFDHAWRTQIDTLQYRPPVEDFQYHTQYSSLGMDDGGDSTFDVYIEDLGTRIAGYTNPESVVSGRKLPAYIVVDNDFAGVKPTLAEAIDLLRVTAAHELFHAVQFGYDAHEDIYWFEQSAVWMEERGFESVNDYLTYVRLFSGFLTEPWVSLDARNGEHEFAGVLWPLYLAQRFGQTIIRTIWERAETVQSLDAMDQALQVYQSTLQAAFQEFTIWNVFTGSRANPARSYREGDLYPGVAADTVRSYPISGPSSTHRWPAHLAANYLFLYPDQARLGGLQMTFTGLTGDWGVSVAGLSAAGADTVFTMPLTAQQGTAAIYDWDAYTVIVLVPAALNRSGNNLQYQYTAAFDSTLTRRTPTVVELTTFTATEDRGIVTVTWTTASAPDLAGFNLYRSHRPHDGFTRQNPTLLTGQSTFQYLDANVQANQVYYYRLEAVSSTGQRAWFGPISQRVTPPPVFVLHQNAPNPFNLETTIRFDLPALSRTTLRVYNLLGQEVIMLLNDEEKPAGYYTIRWNGRNRSGDWIASGVYLYQLTTNTGLSQTRRMTLVK